MIEPLSTWEKPKLPVGSVGFLETNDGNYSIVMNVARDIVVTFSISDYVIIGRFLDEARLRDELGLEPLTEPQRWTAHNSSLSDL